MYIHTYAYAYICTRIHMRIYDTVQTRWRMASETQNLCTNMYTHTHVHACMCISIHIHMQIFTYMHVHTHMHTYKYAHTYNVCICTHASTPGTTALQWLRKELMQTPESPHVSFVRRNQPYLAPLMLGFYCTHFLRHHWYPCTPHPLFPTYPRTVRGPRQVRFYCSTLINTTECTTRRSFTVALCVVVERLEGKQRCTRAPVGEHTGRQAREWPRDCSRETKGQQRTAKPRSNPSHHHNSAAPRQHPLICTSAEPIHPVHGPPKLLATEVIPQNESHLCHFRGSNSIVRGCNGPARLLTDSRMHIFILMPTQFP